MILVAVIRISCKDLVLRKYNRVKENINQEEERISSCVSDFKQDLLRLGEVTNICLMSF